MFDFDALDEADQTNQRQQGHKSDVAQTGKNVEVQHATPAKECRNASQVQSTAVPGKVASEAAAGEAAVDEFVNAASAEAADQVAGKVTEGAAGEVISHSSVAEVQVQFVTLGTGVAAWSCSYQKK